MGKKNKKGYSDCKEEEKCPPENKEERVSAIGRYMKQMTSDEKPKNNKKNKRYR